MNTQLEFRAYDTVLQQYTQEGEFVFYSYGTCECEFQPNSIAYARDKYHSQPKAIRNARFKIECRFKGGEWFPIHSGLS